MRTLIERLAILDFRIKERRRELTGLYAERAAIRKAVNAEKKQAKHSPTAARNAAMLTEYEGGQVTYRQLAQRYGLSRYYVPQLIDLLRRRRRAELSL